MDVVGVMGAYLPVVCVCTAQCREALPGSASLDCAVHTHTRARAHTHTRGKYAAITPTTFMSTDEIEPLL